MSTFRDHAVRRRGLHAICKPVENTESGQSSLKSARQPERLGYTVADRLGGCGHDFLRERRKLLDLRRRKFELLALMRERQLEHFGRRLRLEYAVRKIERRIGVLPRDLH